jgi:hypothetical protein
MVPPKDENAVNQTCCKGKSRFPAMHGTKTSTATLWRSKHTLVKTTSSATRHARMRRSVILENVCPNGIYRGKTCRTCVIMEFWPSPETQAPLRSVSWKDCVRGYCIRLGTEQNSPVLFARLPASKRAARNIVKGVGEEENGRMSTRKVRGVT